MPWPTTRGLRTLDGAVAELLLGAIGMMVDGLVAEMKEDAQPTCYGISWFDNWDPPQRIWLLDEVTPALFGTKVIESPAAMFDATVDAVFLEVQDLIEFELNDDSESSRSKTWRSAVSAALEQSGAESVFAGRLEDSEFWCRVITLLGDGILGVRLYQRAESFRDHDYERTQTFLRDRGLPEDYLSRIPPLRTVDQTQRSIDRIQDYVFRD